MPSLPQSDSLRTRVVWGGGSAVVLALVWEVAGRRSDSLLLPSAAETLAALARLVARRELWEALWLSNQSLAVGFPAALAAEVAGGLVLARWPALDRWLAVYLDILLVVPKSALMPLVVIALGFGLTARALVVFTFSFPIVVVTVRAGVKEVDRRLLAMARAFCASEVQIWRRVLVPGALPAIMTAVRLGLARSVAGMVSVELLLVAIGIGQLIMTFRADFDAASLYAAIFVVVTEAVLLISLAGALERRFGSWSGSDVVAD
jgi:NitT/TauT family transport system permease protein